MSLSNAALGGLSRATVAPLARFDLRAVLIGAVTSTGFTISARTALVELPSLSLEVSADPAFTRLAATVAGASTAANSYWAQFAVTGLLPDTMYYTRVRNGALVGDLAPTVRTFKAGAMSFTMPFLSCCNQGYNPVTFERILALNPTVFLHQGDFHYADVVADDETLNFQYLNDAAERGRQAALYAAVPLIYQPSDHDSGSNNYLLGWITPAVQSCYRKMFPSYTLPGGATGWYQACTIGRVRLIVLDTRSFASYPNVADSASKRLIGAAQLTWLQGELSAANAAKQAIVIAVNSGWCGGYSGSGQDGWYDYQYERLNVLNYINANNIRRVCVIHGDMHGICVDDGTFSQTVVATPELIPCYGAAPADASSSVRGGGWSHGSWPLDHPASNVNQYGVLSVEDDGGATLTMTFRGYEAKSDTLLVTHSRVLSMV